VPVKIVLDDKALARPLRPGMSVAANRDNQCEH